MDFIPDVSLSDLKRIILRDFPQYDPQVVIDVLKEYHTDSSGVRVQMAVLKLADGNLEKLKSWIAQANLDFRDVLMAAEYPNFAKKGAIQISKVERNRLRKLDWEQYQQWLNRK